ncbi:hypothetical protein BDA96_06G208700 [Sorghum bicolor]|uniref:Uncharacterized protein n=2 Tax=Sorghum bicolor TaxID=4558 RepID=A0A921UD55_SORBI|nr:hypothetical protein BDA96_06G208700 [Sorghum bicolor]KXG26986.1 hypothetical protein SORBI_3006G191400 [Sorghum bicolor]
MADKSVASPATAVVASPAPLRQQLDFRSLHIHLLLCGIQPALVQCLLQLGIQQVWICHGNQSSMISASNLLIHVYCKEMLLIC